MKGWEGRTVTHLLDEGMGGPDGQVTHLLDEGVGGPDGQVTHLLDEGMGGGGRSSNPPSG